MLKCAACGGSNRDEARFCSSCGVGLAGTCAGCGTDLPPGSRYERMDDFLRKRQAWDADRVFLNRFEDKVFQLNESAPAQVAMVS